MSDRAVKVRKGIIYVQFADPEPARFAIHARRSNIAKEMAGRLLRALRTTKSDSQYNNVLKAWLMIVSKVEGENG